jgi:hypothetical protein
MKKTCLLAVAAGMACCSVALAKPPIEQLRQGPEIQPISMAKVARVNGKVVLASEWLPYTGGSNTRSPQINVPAFDAFGREPGTAPFGTAGTHCPASCVLPNGQTVDNGIRWYFGSTYHNPNTIEDMQDCACPPGSIISEVDLGFFWSTTGECYIVYFPFEEVMAFDVGTGLCTDPSALTPTGNGVAFYYGALAGSTSFYYYSRPTGVEVLGVALPSTDDNGDASGFADGSYQQIFASAVTSSGITLAPGPCQPMLWGTSTNGTGPADCRPGHNNADSYDDDGPTDGVHSNPGECYDYTFGLCPDPMGKDNGFCYLRCPADYNNDGFVDGIDADNFNNTFEGAGPLPQSCADLNGDCFVDGIDADYFNNEFESAC